MPLFYVVGKPVKASLSPCLHNEAFSVFTPRPTYKFFETDQLADVQSLLAQPATIGCSVTTPLKEEVFQVCDEISPAARQIGAINTLTKKEGRVVGDNTDYKGLLDAWLSHPQSTEVSSAIVVGAGGTARAAILGFLHQGIPQIQLVNRTLEKATQIAADFREHLEIQCRTPEDIQLEAHLQVVVFCIPAHAFSSYAHLAEQLKEKPAIVVDVSYQGRGQTNECPVKIQPDFTGKDVLLEQAVYQQEEWIPVLEATGFVRTHPEPRADLRLRMKQALAAEPPEIS